MTREYPEKAGGGSSGLPDKISARGVQSILACGVQLQLRLATSVLLGFFKKHSDLWTGLIVQAGR